MNINLLVLLELGMDYMHSGLFDRAESLFKELSDSKTYSVQVFTQLLDIYQQKKDWSRVIVIARSLGEVSDEKLSPIIAQFYCELAEEYLETDRGKKLDNISN